jgi:hypothetical protein
MIAIMTRASSDGPLSPATKASPYKRGLIPIWLHVVISMTSVIIGFVGALTLGVVVLHRLRLSGQSLVGFAMFALPVFAAVLVPMYVMYKWVPARCCQCGGRCWAPSPKRNDTLKYICEHCGNVVDTRMRGGPG